MKRNVITSYSIHYTKLYELEAAVRRAREQVDDTPDNEALQYLLAWLYMERKDYPSALTVYRAIDRLKGSEGVEIVKFATRAFNDRAFAVAAQAFGSYNFV